MDRRLSAALVIATLSACGARTSLPVGDAAAGFDAPSPLDLGHVDASRLDLGMTDGSPPDLGPDAPMRPDLGVDLGPPDLGPPDLGPPDLGPPDLGPPDLGLDAGPPATLRGLRAELPCTGPLRGGLCPTPATATDSALLMGASGVTYDVAFRVRGVTEGRTYTCSTTMGSWCVAAGAPSRGDNYNVWGLAVDSPMQQFYVNAGPEAPESFVLDDVHVVRVASGGTVTLLGDSINSFEFPNRDAAGVPVVVPGVPPDPMAFDGEFVQVDVLSITAVP